MNKIFYIRLITIVIFFQPSLHAIVQADLSIKPDYQASLPIGHSLITDLVNDTNQKNLSENEDAQDDKKNKREKIAIGLGVAAGVLLSTIIATLIIVFRKKIPPVLSNRLLPDNRLRPLSKPEEKVSKTQSPEQSVPKEPTAEKALVNDTNKISEDKPNALPLKEEVGQAHNADKKRVVEKQEDERKRLEDEKRRQEEEAKKRQEELEHKRQEEEKNAEEKHKAEEEKRHQEEEERKKKEEEDRKQTEKARLAEPAFNSFMQEINDVKMPEKCSQQVWDDLQNKYAELSEKYENSDQFAQNQADQISDALTKLYHAIDDLGNKDFNIMKQKLSEFTIPQKGSAEEFKERASRLRSDLEAMHRDSFYASEEQKNEIIAEINTHKKTIENRLKNEQDDLSDRLEKILEKEKSMVSDADRKWLRKAIFEKAFELNKKYDESSSVYERVLSIADQQTIRDLFTRERDLLTRKNGYEYLRGVMENDGVDTALLEELLALQGIGDIKNLSWSLSSNGRAGFGAHNFASLAVVRSGNNAQRWIDFALAKGMSLTAKNGLAASPLSLLQKNNPDLYIDYLKKLDGLPGHNITDYLKKSFSDLAKSSYRSTEDMEWAYQKTMEHNTTYQSSPSKLLSDVIDHDVSGTMTDFLLNQKHIVPDEQSIKKSIKNETIFGKVKDAIDRLDTQAQTDRYQIMVDALFDSFATCSENMRKLACEKAMVIDGVPDMALHRAATIKNSDLIRLLLDKGLNPSVEDRSKKPAKTAIHKALDAGNKEFIDLIADRLDSKQKRIYGDYYKLINGSDELIKWHFF